MGNCIRNECLIQCAALYIKENKCSRSCSIETSGWVHADKVVGSMTLLQTIAGDFVNKITQEIKRPENKDIVRVHLLDPVIEYTFGRLYPYIIVTSIIFFLTFVIATVVLIVVLRR